MLCLVHGYGLTGSGSNQWTRSIARALCEVGETVHLICQEMGPEQFDFVSSATIYDEAGRPENLFERDVPYDGKCIVHRPLLTRLPTYVRPQATNPYMASMLDLSADEIDEYLQRNERTVRRVFSDHEITAVHVNHVVLMAVVVHRVCSELHIPFGVMPHGSAIEYVVKHDERMHEFAAAALEGASVIFALSNEMRDRIQSVFPGISRAGEKMVPASAGVDTRLFRVIERAEREDSIARLRGELSNMGRGKTRAQRRKQLDGITDRTTLPELTARIRETEDYPPKLPDDGVEDLLGQVDWARDEIILFVGTITGYKGLPALVAAFPAIAARRPNARLIIAGRGNLRGGIEIFANALGSGRRRLAQNIVKWGGAVEGEAAARFESVARYYSYLSHADQRQAYYVAAERFCTPERILFTGYLEHHLLCHLFPCCDVAIFPSVVTEASPLVVPEAMASGCFPIGTDFAGMGASLDVASEAVPADVAGLMRLRPDPEFTVRDIIDNVSSALDVADRYRESLREVAVRRFDWRSVACNLATAMKQMRIVGAGR